MYANFTEETCTGTGATLALAGATTGNLRFVNSYADGDLVPYVVEDADGITKVAGVGTYVAATDDITRNDTWNWDGTSVDKNPTTNIPLSGGTHTIRCAVDESYVFGYGDWDGRAPRIPNLSNRFINSTPNSANFVMVANRVYFTKLYIPRELNLTEMGTFQIVAASGTKARVGLYSIKYDSQDLPLPDQLLIETGDLDMSTTGFNRYGTISPSFTVSKGNYLLGIVCDDAPTISGGNITRGAETVALAIVSPNTGFATAWRYDISSGWTSLPDMTAIDFAGLDGNEGFSFPFPVALFEG